MKTPEQIKKMIQSLDQAAKDGQDDNRENAVLFEEAASWLRWVLA